jgi:hypothetical protein
MRKRQALLAVWFLLVATVAYAESGKINLTAGDTVYVCGCGEVCPCETLSKQKGTCGCGTALVEGKVVSVADGKAVVESGGKQRTFRTAGLFACGCENCPCGTVSQRPGKCACGKPLKPVQ